MSHEFNKVSPSGLPVIFYRYDGSPFCDKLDSLLLLKGVPHFKVNVPIILPRPELSDLLGINYRRVPVLVIGRHAYCDTGLISSIVERKYAQKDGHGTIFPKRKGGGLSDTGMIKAFVLSYADNTLFPLGAASLPYEKMPESFIKDRSSLRGSEIDVRAIADALPKTKSFLASHLTLLEEQLSDGREWLFDTETPSLADAATHIVYNWVLRFRKVRDVGDPVKFPNSLAWINRMSQYLKRKADTGAASFKTITANNAAELVSTIPMPDLNSLHFDTLEASRLGVDRFTQVQVFPNDSGRNWPTVGKLVGLDREEVVLLVGGSAVSELLCHFPRLGFTILPQRPRSKL